MAYYSSHYYGAGASVSLGSGLERTVRDVLIAAFRRINLVQAGEVPSGEDLADGFDRFNDLVDSYQTERLLQAPIQRVTWTISSTQGTLATPYTIGSGGDVNLLRPVTIMAIRYQDTSTSPTTEYPLSLLTDAQWQAIPQKDLTSPLPTSAFYDPTFAGHLGSLYLWPVPTQAHLQGVLYAPTGVPCFESVNDVLVLPPGYFRFLRDNLAVELASEWRDSLPADQGLIRSAMESKAQIKRANMRTIEMSTGWGSGQYDINSDEILR